MRAEELLGPQRPAEERLPIGEPEDCDSNTWPPRRRREGRMRGRLHMLRSKSESAKSLGSQAIEYGDPPRQGQTWRVHAAGADDPRGWSVGRVERIRETPDGLYVETIHGGYLLETIR